MNSMIHNTSWVTAHFHLIFGGAVVIMYFAIAYEMWPAIQGVGALANSGCGSGA
jgi:cytochrome c oxidase subunit 1